MTRAFNHLIVGTMFDQRFGRWPLPVDHPDALVNDVIFDRMIDPAWSSLQQAFVDKETAKIEAQRCVPGIRVPETLAVIPMAEVRSVEHLYALLAPFIGADAIAKPSHASGAAIFMQKVAAPADLRGLYDLALRDYASILREMQYWRLPRKIIVESIVPSATALPPDDYKFHCVHGEPLVCQVDHNRFGAPWSRIWNVPDFAPMDPADGLVPPAHYRLPTPERRAAMIDAARALAASFDYVRVDLYDGADGIYFGELTFTPAASLGIAPSSQGDHRINPTHRIYSRIMMTALAHGRQVNGG